MGKTVTFLHVADIHLGAPVRGLRALTDEWAARLAHAIPESFARVIDTAIARKVDFVVFAGDAFDASRASYAEYEQFFEALDRLDGEGIASYLVAGNHDPYTTWSRDIDRLPPSAHLIGVEGSEYVVFFRAGEPICLIGGRSYYNQTWPTDQNIAEGITREAMEACVQAPFAIGIIHTGLDIDVNKAPASVDELLAADIDYWACGHLHLHMQRPDGNNPRIVFPGCIQGRDIKETGERGCYLVTLEEGSAPQLEFVPTSSVVLETIHVDVGACITLSDLVHLVASRLFHENGKAHCDELVVHVILEGETDLHRFLADAIVIADIRKQINEAYPSFYCDALIDRTIERRRSAEESGGSLFSQVIAEIAEDQRGRGEAMINYVQNEFVKRGIAVPGSLSRRVDAFEAAAETIVSDLLREGEQ